MATDREVMQQALADLEYFAQQGYDCSDSLTALRARLAEPGPEPVAVGHLVSPYGEWKPNFNLKCKFPAESLEWSIPLYFHPPTRRPLTDEEILKTVGWEIAEMYFKLKPGFPVAEARAETLKNARAIERAHRIGGNDE